MTVTPTYNSTLHLYAPDKVDSIVSRMNFLTNQLDLVQTDPTGLLDELGGGYFARGTSIRSATTHRAQREQPRQDPTKRAARAKPVGQVRTRSS